MQVDFQRGPRRVRAPRRHADDDVGHAGFGRGRRRSTPHFDHEYRRRGPRDRNYVLCRARAGAPGRRRRASGLLKLFVETEYLADAGAILATRRRRTPSEPEIWAAHLAVVDGETVGEAAYRDRPSAVPRPRPRHSHADRGDRRPSAVEYGRHRSRPDLLDAPPRADRAGRDRSRRVLDHGRFDPRPRCSTRRQASRRHRLRPRRRCWPGRRRRCSSTISA